MGCLYFRSSTSLAFSFFILLLFSVCLAYLPLCCIRQRKSAGGACNGNMGDMALQATACRGGGEVMSQVMIHLPHFS